MPELTADQIIARLDLAPHPEGGYYRRTWIAGNAGRATGTCIYFLLKAGQETHWHAVDAVEIWHYYAGASLMLSCAPTLEGPAVDQHLGPDIGAGQLPQAIVPEGHWQKAATTGAWTLVGCRVDFVTATIGVNA